MPGIRSIGWWVPEGRRTASALATDFHVAPEALAEFGLKSRVEPDEDDHPSTMGARATKYALEAAGLAIDDVGLLINASMTHDYPAPWVGAYGVLHELGARRTAGLDVGNRCASVHDALWLAAKLIDAGTHERVVVCCADRFDYLFDHPRANRIADLAYSAGAAAAVVDNAAPNEIASYAGYANPDTSLHVFNVPRRGGTRRQVDEDSFVSGLHRERNTMNLKQSRDLQTYVQAADARTIASVANAAGFREIDFVIASPLDVRAQLASLAELGLAKEKTYFLLPVLGHMGPADSLVNLATAAGHKKIGTRIVMSTRTVTYANAVTLRAKGRELGILVKGSGITQHEIDQCL